jgi:Ni,Fe-hydrogenase I cytochrome b subunit
VGHNPMASLFMFLMFVTGSIFMIFTGFALYADFKHLRDQNHREKSGYVASEFIAPSLLLKFAKILIFIKVDIFKHTAKKIRKLNKQIKFYLKAP